MARLRQLREQRMQIATQMRGILETAEREGRSLSAEEQSNYDKAFTQQSELRETIQRLERQADLDRELGQPVTETRGDRNGRPDDAPGGDDGAERRRAERDEEEAETREFRNGVLVSTTLRETRAERRAALRALARNTPEVRAAFRSFLAGGIRGLSAEEHRTLTAGIDAEGGFLVAAPTFVAGILQRLDDAVHVRSRATVRTVAAAQTLGVITLEDDVEDPEWTAELQTGSDTDMTFGKREARPHPAARRIKVSRTLLRAAGSVVEGLIQQRFAYKFGLMEERAFLLGHGANQPLGIFTPSVDGVPLSRDVAEGNEATKITFDGLLAAKYSLKEPYRRTAEWMFHRDAILRISQLKDAENRYLWQPSVTAGQPDRIHNIPVTESEHVPNTFTTGKYVGALCNWEFYWIIDALSMQMQRLDELYAEQNKVGFIARKETDAQPVMPEAFVRVKLA